MSGGLPALAVDTYLEDRECQPILCDEPRI
jgi:hypothetical protein